MRLCWLACALLFTTNAIAAGNWPPAKKLDAWFDMLERDQLANCAVAVSENGELRYERFVGFERSGPRPARIDEGTRFNIGPVTQLFTAVLTLQLAEKGTITLDNGLAEFFPDLPNALKISYRDLLQHRSGLADYVAGSYSDYQRWRFESKTPDQVMQRIAAAGVAFEPRARAEYSTSNYFVLGRMLEEVYEKPYAEILRRRITDPIGLANTGATSTDAGHAIVAAELGAPPDSGVPVSTWMQQTGPVFSIHGGAGSIVSTPANLVRFMDALFARRLVGEHSLASLRGQADVPGLGLTAIRAGTQTAYGVGGVIDGHWAAVYHFPEKKISFSFASSAPQLPPEDILDECFALLFEPGHRPRTLPRRSPDQKTLRQFVGVWRWDANHPPDTAYRRFLDPGEALELRIASTPAGLVRTRPGGEADQLVYLGGNDFRLDRKDAGASWYLRFVPQSNQLVVRDYDRAWYLMRAE